MNALVMEKFCISLGVQQRSLSFAVQYFERTADENNMRFPTKSTSAVPENFPGGPVPGG